MSNKTDASTIRVALTVLTATNITRGGGWDEINQSIKETKKRRMAGAPGPRGWEAGNIAYLFCATCEHLAPLLWVRYQGPGPLPGYEYK